MTNRPSPCRSSALLLLLTLVPLTGCLIGSNTQTSSEGTYISKETVEQLLPGAEMDAVLGLFGDPTSKSKLDGGVEIWRWHYREATTSQGAVFLLFGEKSEKQSQSTVFVRFEDERVVKVWKS